MTGAPEPTPPPDPEAPEPHDETMIESSVLEPYAASTRGPTPTRGALPIRFFITTGIAVIAIGAIGFAAAVRAQRLQTAQAKFERVLVEGTPEEALAASHDLPPAIRDDPTFKARLDELERRVAARAYLNQIGDFWIGLQAAKSYRDRIALCDRALEAKIEPVRISTERARATFEIGLRKAKTNADVDALLSALTTDLGRANALDVTPPWGRFALALLRFRHRGPKAAAQDLERAQGGEAGRLTPLETLLAGLEHQLGGREQVALSHYGNAINNDARLSDAYQLRGELRLARGNLKGARLDAVRAAELDPLSSAARLLLSETELRRGDRKAARAAVKALVEADPHNASGLGLLAYLDAESDDPDVVKSSEALSARALTKNPRADWAILANATRLRHAGHPRKAATQARAALKIRPRLETHLLQARLALDAGDTTSALQHLTHRVLRRHSMHREGLLLAIKTRVALRQYDEALRLVTKLQRTQESAEGYYWLGRIHLTRRPQNVRLATEALTQSIALDPNHAAALAFRAYAYAETGSSVSALADLAKAEKLGLGTAMPSWEVALIRGKCHTRLGEKDKAIRAYRTYQSSAPVGHHRRSWVRMTLKRLQQ